MYLSTTDSIVGHRVVRTVGPVWGIGNAFHEAGYKIDENGFQLHMANTASWEARQSVKEAMESLLDSVREAGGNGVIGLTQVALATGNQHQETLQSVYILMGTAVVVE